MNDPAERYILENFEKWNFKNILIEDNIASNAKFYLTLNRKSEDYSLDYLCGDKYYLCRDGKFKKLENFDELEVYTSGMRENILEISNKCSAYVLERLKENAIEIDKNRYFKAEIKKIKNPSHLFTKEDLLQVIRNADNRVNNNLVLDENGYVKMIQNESMYTCYPVCFSTFGAYTSCVGEHCTLNDIGLYYSYLMYGLNSYLKNGKYNYISDYIPENLNEIIIENKKIIGNE